MPTIKHFFGLFLIILSSVGSYAAPPNITVDYAIALDIEFEKRAVAVAESQRNYLAARIANAFQVFPNGFVCAIVVGYSEIDEGDKDALHAIATSRSKYVAELLERNGVSISNIHRSEAGASQPIAKQPSRRNSRVEVEILPYCGEGPANTSAHSDKQHQAAAARQLLRAGGLQRWSS
jgi:predicted NBD/HSP70 family sugar kinase